MKRLGIALSLLLGLVGPVFAEGEDGAKRLTLAERLAMAERLAASAVRVELTLRFDQGEAPTGLNIGSYAGWFSSTGYEQLVSEERPLELPGFLLAPDRVICPDVQLHPRFIKELRVVFGEQQAAAERVALAKFQNAALLSLAQPLQGAVPLEFVPTAPRPYLAVSYQEREGEWGVAIGSAGAGLFRAESGRSLLSVSENSLLVDRQGRPVGMYYRDELAADDGWKGSPLEWPWLDAAELARQDALLAERAGAGLVRVRLSFRSPKKDAGGGGLFGGFSFSDDEEDDETERNAVGVLLDARRVLVLSGLKPKVTARLEGVEVYPDPAAKPVSASFSASLRDYGAFVATLGDPLAQGGLAFSDRELRSLRHEYLPTVHISVQGERQLRYRSHSRVQSYEIGWRRMLLPEFAAEAEGYFLFDQTGALLAVPLSRRPRGGEEDDPFTYVTSDEVLMFPAAYLDRALDVTDPNNLPLSAEDENRLAWLGVELQPLDQDLARANGVSHLTQDGETGTLVSYVYPGSPAAEAGIEPGAILIRLHVPDRPKPIEVKLEPSFGLEGIGDLMKQLEGMAPGMLGDMGGLKPWPSVENHFNQTLTGIGFGKPFVAELFIDGEVVRKDFVVAQGPPHYEAASPFKSEELGLSVKDLTFEVRRYFQHAPDAPGVIVSKVEPGSRAAVAGVQIFETITHVEDQPVTSAAQFGEAIAGKDELQLKVKRKAQVRIVKIKKK